MAMAAYFYITVMTYKFCHPNHYLNKICTMACCLSDHSLYVSEKSLYRPGELKHYVELHKFTIFTQMQDKVFPLNLVLQYLRSS